MAVLWVVVGIIVIVLVGAVSYKAGRTSAMNPRDIDVIDAAKKLRNWGTRICSIGVYGDGCPTPGQVSHTLEAAADMLEGLAMQKMADERVVAAQEGERA